MYFREKLMTYREDNYCRERKETLQPAATEKSGSAAVFISFFAFMAALHFTEPPWHTFFLPAKSFVLFFR